MGATVRLDSTRIEARPGAETSCTVHLENDGAVVDGFLLDVLGPAREWAGAQPAEVNLLPGASAEVKLVFAPPRSSALPAGPVPFALRVMSREDPDGSTVEEGEVTVGEYGEISAALVPKTATGRRSARYRLVVENRGNRAEQLSVAVSDPDVKLSFRTRPAVFEAEPGTATYVTVRAVPRKRFLRGAGKTHPFEAAVIPAPRPSYEVSAGPDADSANGAAVHGTVPVSTPAQPGTGAGNVAVRPGFGAAAGTAAAAAGPAAEVTAPVSTDGVMLQRQTLPEWLIPAVAAMTVVAGIVLALWFAVLRPVVHSAATSAANAQNAASAAMKVAGSKAAPPNALDLALSPSTLLTGTSKLASVTAGGGGGAVPKLVWTSSAPSVATVSQTGVVTALSPGSATITATTSGASGGSGGHGGVGAAAAAPGAAPLSGSTTVNVVGPVAVSPAPLAEAALGKPYNASVEASGGTGSFTWTITSGALPPGLSLSAGGQVTGTPTALGSSTFTVHLADAGPPTQFATRKLTLDVVNALAINTSALAQGRTGTAYAQSLAVVGGTGPFTWTIAPGSGTLPAGLSLDSATGQITGTPTSTGDSSFQVQVADSGTPPQTATQQLSVDVVAPVSISTLSLAAAVADQQYSQSPTVTGGTAPYSWSVSAGSLPPGLTLNPSTGTVSGTPTTLGTTDFTLQATDDGHPQLAASQAYSIAVVQAFDVATSSVPDGAVGQAYPPTQLTGVGGTSPYVWTLTGTLPPGMTLSPAGMLGGTPTATGMYTFSVQAADSSAPPLSGTQSLSLAVVSPLSVATHSLPAAVTGTQYSETLGASGGTKPYTWSLAPGSSPLPPGVNLDPGSGSLSGTPTAVGTYAFTVQLTDGGTPPLSATATETLTVVSPLTFTEPQALPPVVAGRAFTQPQDPIVTGGTGPYTWSLAGGTTLPAQLNLDPRTGAISGTVQSDAPTAVDVVQLEVTDSSTPPIAVSEPVTLQVVSALKVNQPTMPVTAAGSSVDVDLTQYIQGGQAPYTITPQSADGLTLDSTGQLKGSPGDNATSAPWDETVSLVLIVTDSTPGGAQTVQIPFSVTVTPPPLLVKWQPSGLDGYAPLDSNYSEPTVVSISGGLGSYSYSMTSSPSTSDFSVNSSGDITGGVYGFDSCDADYTFTVTVTSSDGQSASSAFTMSCHV